MRMTAADYLQARQQLVTNVAPIQSEEEVALFVELLREHLPQRPTQSIDWVSLTREFNRRVLRRAPGTALRLKTHTYLQDYAKHLMKRVQVDNAQQSLLSKVRLCKSNNSNLLKYFHMLRTVCTNEVAYVILHLAYTL